MIEFEEPLLTEINTFIPYEDSRNDLVETLYKLLTLIHKEPNCLDYEVFIEESGAIMTMGRFKNALAYNLHENMHYIQEFRRKDIPVFCEQFEMRVVKKVTPPLTALSLLNEK